MSWDARQFSDVGSADGTIRVDMGGRVMEMPYTAALWLDGAATVLGVAAEGQRGTSWLFVSRVGDGDGVVYTQGGPREGDSDIDGRRLVVAASRERDEILAAHVLAVGDSAIAGADALLALAADAPQTAVDLAAEVMKRLAASFMA